MTNNMDPRGVQATMKTAQWRETMKTTQQLKGGHNTFETYIRFQQTALMLG